MLNILKKAFMVTTFVVGIVAQLDTGDIPQACVSPCQKLLDLGNTCVVEYPEQGSSPRATACLCNGIASLEYSSCTSCLTSGAPSLAQSVSQLSTFCSDFVSGCEYECAFETCAASDVQCQCAEPYLQQIYNCASCNSAHNNANSTLLADYNALHDSCSNQGHTSAPTSTDPLPTPSGIVSYTGGSISISNVMPGSTTGAVSHVPIPTSSRVSSTGRVSGTNTGSTSTSATFVGGSPSSLTGSAGRVDSKGFDGALAPVAAMLLVMMVLGVI